MGVQVLRTTFKYNLNHSLERGVPSTTQNKTKQDKQA